MSKLYFKYGTMGSSKTAQLLMTKRNYEDKNMKTWLIKPIIDDRDGVDIVHSRIGLQENADTVIKNDDDILDLFSSLDYKTDVVLCDEAQFLTTKQVEQLHSISALHNVSVICFGLLTDFTSHLFEGSKRLIEISESIQEIKTVCRCGKKATINARICNGKVVCEGEQVQIGGDEMYESMCYNCWVEKLNEKNK